MPKATAKIRKVLISTHHRYDNRSVSTACSSLEMRDFQLRMRLGTKSNFLLRWERWCFFTEIYGSLGMHAEPEKCSKERQDCRNVQRAVPTETLGNQWSEGRGDSATQIPSHVHETGHGAGMSLGQIDGGSPVRGHGQK